MLAKINDLVLQGYLVRPSADEGTEQAAQMINDPTRPNPFEWSSDD